MNQPAIFAEDEELRGRLAAIVQSSSDAILSKTLDGIITSWNAGAERLYGYTAAEAVGQPVSMLVPEDQPDEIPAILERLRRGERVSHYETIRQAKDGRRLTISLTVSPIKDRQGQIVGASAVARDITDRKQAEQAIARLKDEVEHQKRLYETIIANTPDLIYIFKLDYRIAYANKALLAMWGRSRDDAIGKRLHELGYEPWHAQMHEREIDQVVATRQPVRGEVPFRHHELGPRSYDYIMVPILGPDGQVEAVAGTTRDVTERRRANEALRRSEQQRGLALTAADMGTWDHDIASGLVHLDPRTAELFGEPGQSSLPLEVAVSRLHHEDREDVARRIEAAIDPASDGHYDVECRVCLEGREPRWLRAVGQAMFEGDGPRRRAVRFVGVVFDTTATRTAREALQAANRRAERNLAQLQAVVGQMTEGLLIFDPQGNLLSMNQAALAIHDFASFEEVQQQRHRFATLFEAFDVETGQPLPAQDWATSQALRGETFTDFEMQVHNQHSGRTWIASCGGTPVRDAEGRMQVAIVTVRDITARKQAEQRLQQLNDTLEQRVAERTAMAERRANQLQRLAGELTEVEHRERRRLAQLLHDDLQQLLVAAKLRVSAAAGDGGKKLDEAEQLLVQAIHTSRSLTSELAPPVLYDLGLNAALEWLARWALDRYELKVEIESDSSEPVEGEQLSVLMFDAVRELLLNVVKHAKVNEARVTLLRRDGQLRVTVQDVGTGFDPWTRRADDGKPTGYGLFSLHERLELLDGQVQIDSAPGKGTSIQVTVPLPAAPAAAPSTQRAHDPRKPSDARPAPPTREPRTRVLLTDDHEVVRRGLANLIEQQSDMRIVAEAASGEEAVALARQHRPDVVVMDISLPGISGIEATRRIMSELPRTCVIGLSMHEEHDVAEALHSAGARAYFHKSQAAEQLVQAIRRFAPAARR